MLFKIIRNSGLNHFTVISRSQIQFSARNLCSGKDAFIQQNLSQQPDMKATVPKSKSGFAEAMAKFEGHESFTKMFRKSQLVQMGDPQGKTVEGKIIHIVNDDLYIDFGSKFNCVCPRPSKNGGSYTLGRKVRLLIHDLELSTRFLGAATDLTILEADCTLMGLATKSPSELSPPVSNTSVE